MHCYLCLTQMLDTSGRVKRAVYWLNSRVAVCDWCAWRNKLPPKGPTAVDPNTFDFQLDG